MEFFIFALFFFLFLIPLILGIIIPIHKSHNKATSKIINYDSVMRKFVYKVNLTKDEIIASLNTKHVADELSCTFDFERSTIDFSEYGSHREYYFYIQECDGFSVLRLEQVALIGMQCGVPYKLNPFLVSKLQAEIVPFSQYGF